MICLCPVATKSEWAFCVAQDGAPVSVAAHVELCEFYTNWSEVTMITHERFIWAEQCPKMAVLPKSPGYIRKWLANTESAEVPLCAQAIIGKPQNTKKHSWVILDCAVHLRAQSNQNGKYSESQRSIQDCYRVLVSLISWPGQLLSLFPCQRLKFLARMLFLGILSLPVVTCRKDKGK